jgi:hypothetical protein
MSQSRLVVLLPLLAAAGCYNDAPSQSTLPQIPYGSGPPGGAIDPGYGYNQDADEAANVAGEPPAIAVVDDAPTPSQMAPSEIAPGPVAAAPDPAAPAVDAAPEDDDQDVAEATPGSEGPADPADPTAGVTDVEIDTTLDGYGQWIETDDYGQVWRPDATVVGVDFTPYESGGSWQDTDAGWAFSCDYSWGWLPFHYGRWAWFNDYWGWVPGHKWGPAWVEWRHGGGVVGWRPMAPRIRDHRHGEPGRRDYHYGSRPLVRDHRHAQQHDANWRFATVPDFGRPHIRSHLYRNPAEGLRVTSTVTAPPLRARATVRAGDLMRSRFAAGRPAQPGYGSAQIRDHRSSEPVRAYQPAAPGDRPTRYQPYNPPASRPSLRTQPYNPPARIYQPPVRGENRPVRTYQPPVRSETRPVRTHQPPARVFTPRAPSSAPSRSWSPPPASSGSRGSGSSHSGGSSHGSSGSRGSGSSHSGSDSHSGGGSHGSGGSGRHR